MAGIITDVSEDIKKLQELKNEIESVKKSLKSIDIRVNLDIKENLEAQLKSLMGQYNNLAQKIGETEGKIMLSIKHINEETEKIINSQEKLSNSAKDISGVSNTGTTDTSIETDGVKAQAKAYEELKKAIEEINGVRSNNITRMLREQEQMKQYQKELKDLMAAPKTVDSNKRISELIENIERSKIAIAELRQAVKKDIKLEMAAPGSVDALAQSLSRMKDVWKSLSPEELESPFGKELTASIQQADEKIKELSGTIGEHQRNVGNYASGFKNVRTEQRELTYELAQLTIAYRNMSAAEKNSAVGKEMEKKIADLTNKAATLRDAMADVNRSISVRASDTSNFSSISEGINLIISAFGAATGAAKMLGLSEEDLLEVQTKLQAAYVASNALVRIQNTLQKESALMRGVEVLQTKAATTAINIKTAAEGKGVIVTKAATVAQAAFNAVANANPYVLLATAILSVVGALWAFSKGSSEIKKNAEEFNKSVADTASKSIAKVEELSIKYNRLGDDLKAKESFIRENKKAFQELGVAIQSVLDAENLLVEHKDKFIKAQIEKAKASIYLTTAQDKIKELIKAEEEYNAMPEKKSMYIQTSSFGSGYYKEVDNIEKINKKKEIDMLKTNITGLYEDAAKAESEGGKLLEEAGISAMEQYADGSIKAINKAISEKRELLEKLAIGSDEYNRLSKEIEDLQKKLPSSKQDKSNKEEDKLLKQQEQLAEQLLSLRRKNQQDEINLMEEGTEKKLTQIDLDYQKELDAIEKQREEWKKAQKGKLTDEQETQLSASEENAFKAYQKDVDEVNKAKLEADRKAWQEYFIEFGNYQEKRKNLIQKYDDEIARLQSDSPEYAIKVAEKNQAIEQLDEQYGKSTKAMADLFEDASNKSVSAIQSIIDKYETLVKYLSGESDVTIDLLKELGFTDKDIEKIEKGEISIKDVTDAIKGLKDELKGKSPWQSFVADLGKGIKSIKEAGDDTKKIGQGLTDIGNSVTSFAPALSAFGSNIANIFGFYDSKITGAIDALGGLGQTAAGVGQIMSGDIVGGAMSAVSGISSVVSALDGMFGADYSRYNKMVEEYNQLNDIWDELIDKKLEYIGMSYGAEANKVGKEALELAEKSIESYRILGKERLNAGASIGSHSIGVRMRKGMSKEGWNELRDAAKSIGFDYSSVAEGRMTGLFDLTAKQLDKLKEEAPTFWAKMDGDVREYLDSIIEGEERIQNIQNQVKEQLTQVSFDSVFDSFVDMLMDMDSSAEDFSKNFEQYMQRAILTTMVGNKYRDKLQAWYDSFAKANDDKAGITKEEMERSQAEWDAIVAEALAEREALKNVMGWTGSASQQQGATAGGFETMSQDTATELNGRFTALQIAGEEIKNQNEIQSQSLNLLTMKADTLLSIGSETRNIADDTRDIMARSYLELVQISENTGISAKYLKDIKTDIAEVKKNTSKL